MTLVIMDMVDLTNSVNVFIGISTILRYKRRIWSVVWLVYYRLSAQIVNIVP